MSFLSEQEEADAAHVPHWHLVEPIVLDNIDGTHQLHRFVGRWSSGEVGEWAVLTDKATGEAVLDMSGVKAGGATWRADGALLVRLKGGGDARLLIVDPDIRSFRRIGYDAAPRPIGELQAKLSQSARQVGADGRQAESEDPWLQRDFGPDGRIMVEYFIASQRMSHETRKPKITDVATGEVLLRLDDSLFDGDVQWVADGKLSLFLRHYDSGRGIAVTIDPARRTWSIPAAQTGDLPLSTISDELPRRYRRITAARPTSIAPPKRIAGGAYALIVAMIVAIGIIAYVMLFPERTPPQKLTPLPTFPIRN